MFVSRVNGDLRHNFSFLNEVVLRHGPFLHHLDGHVNGAAPLAPAHHPELARAQLLVLHELRGVDLPLVVAETCGGGRRPVARAGLEARRQSAAVVLVVVHQVWDGAAAVLLRQVELARYVVLYVVVFHMGRWSANSHST